MVQKLFDSYVFLYIMGAFSAASILIKLCLFWGYCSLIRASDSISNAKKKWIKQMKLKFETCYQLKIGVNNVDTFVDKYVSKRKFCGILLSTWENISGQAVSLCLLTASCSGILGIVYDCGKDIVLFTFFAGAFASVIVVIVDNLVNISEHKKLLYLNLKDYFENYLKVRLEREHFYPEQLKQYQKEYFTSVSEADLQIAAAKEDQVEVSNKQALLNKDQNNASKKEKARLGKNEDRQKKFASKEEKKADLYKEKEDKKTSALAKKQEKEAAKLKVKEDKKAALLAKKESKKEAKLAKVENKEAAKHAKSDKKAQIKAEKILKKEETLALKLAKKKEKDELLHSKKEAKEKMKQEALNAKRMKKEELERMKEEKSKQKEEKNIQGQRAQQLKMQLLQEKELELKKKEEEKLKNIEAESKKNIKEEQDKNIVTLSNKDVEEEKHKNKEAEVHKNQKEDCDKNKDVISLTERRELVSSSVLDERKEKTIPLNYLNKNENDENKRKIPAEMAIKKEVEKEVAITKGDSTEVGVEKSATRKAEEDKLIEEVLREFLA